MRLCKVWGQVRYLHPWVVEGAVDWDAALIAALPKALEARSDDDEAAAVSLMFEALHDPVTRVDKPSAPSAQNPTATESRTVDGVVIVPVSLSGAQDISPTSERLNKALATAKLVVLDLRGSSQGGEVVNLLTDSPGWPVPHETFGLASRIVEHHGYRPQSGITSGGYQTWLATRLPTTHPVVKGAAHPSRVVFLSNTAVGVPDLAWAMQRAGDAAIVMQGPFGPEQFAATNDIPLAGGYVAHVRGSELTEVAPRADVQLDANADEAKVIEAAVRAAKRRGVPWPPRRAASERAATWHPDQTYDDQPYPSKERRILALFRFWNVINLFYPYLPLMGDSWEQALVDFIPRFEAAPDAREYALDVAELAARIPDGHVTVWGGKELASATLQGAARAPFDLRMIEGQPVVVRLLEQPSGASSGVAVGDVVLAVDGGPLDARLAKVGKYRAASNDTWRSYFLLRTALTGDAGSSIRVTVREASGATRDVSVARTTNWSFPERTGPVYRLLDDAIGYVDLDRLENRDVDAMFAAFEKTRGIVFDMRGYPHGTAWTVAPRLNVRHARAAAQFFEPLVGFQTPERSFFEQPIPPTDKPLYHGKTVMLIDERTMSQSEHTGLFFEAANGTKFIGSQTAGANGDVTNLSLPGGLFVRFSGHDVRHADGRQLQRVGLVPDIEVHPTIAGLRAGRDEVLERAVEYLRTGR